jgi:hypothetical protein
VWSKKNKERPIKHAPTEVNIDTTGEPQRSKLRMTTLEEDHITWNHITRMLKRKVIRPSNSPWAAPILLADKKGGKVRFALTIVGSMTSPRRMHIPFPGWMKF